MLHQVFRHAPPQLNRSGVARKAVLCMAACLSLAGCGVSRSAGSSSAEAERTTTAVPPELAPGLSMFAELEAQVAPGSNIVVSPFSVRQAFGLAHLGARGDTAQQIETTFGLPSGDALAQRLSSAQKGLLESGDGVRIRIANALWLSGDRQFLPAFPAAAREHYQAHVAAANFRSPAAAAKTINHWAGRETEGLIPQIVGTQDIDPDTAAFLTNAVFFDGRWTEPFIESETREWLTPDGKRRPFAFMKRIGEYAAVEHKGWRAIRLPYGPTGRFAMDVMLPAAKGPLPARTQPALTSELIGRLDATDRASLRLHLPRFEIDFRSDLQESLKRAGLTLPFDPLRADFSGMTGPVGQRLYIDRVLHAAKLQVFEKGTKAAAVTALRVSPVSAPPPWNGTDFVIDQPFLFAIRDTQTGTLLFFGRVNDPKPFEAGQLR